MPRPTQNKLYKSFVKGLVTEAGPLTYPENASTDELNTVIKVKGSRSRRFGIDWEPSSIAANIDVGSLNTNVSTCYAWKAVGNDSSVNFLCVQVAGKIYFYDIDATPITGTAISFTIDLTTFASPTATVDQIKDTPVQMASGKGYLFIVSPYIEPIFASYDKTSNTLSTVKIIIAVRDFDGVNDSLTNEDQPTTLSNEHYYNLRNQGWVQPGPNGVVDGTPTTPYSGSAPAGSSSGTGGGGERISVWGSGGLDSGTP